MSSTNDTYHHLLIQTQPKSILKKSPSPRFLDTLINSENEHYSNSILSSTYETERNDIDKSQTSPNPLCILNDHQSAHKDTSVQAPLTTFTMPSNENSYQLIRTKPPIDSSPPSSLTSDDEHHPQQRRLKTKSKKNYSRPFVATGTLSSSSDNNDERKAKRSMEESKPTFLRSNKHRAKDMQLDEFMRKYQQQGGIPLPTKEEYHPEQITTKPPINHHQFSSPRHQTTPINKGSINDDTISLLQSLDTITLSSKIPSPLQVLFNIARLNQRDRRIKIDQIREYVEEEIGISAFLTIYKLIKSSRIPIDLRQKPFCYYVNFLPHLCCLIILESEEQKDRLEEK